MIRCIKIFWRKLKRFSLVRQYVRTPYNTTTCGYPNCPDLQHCQQQLTTAQQWQYKSEPAFPGLLQIYAHQQCRTYDGRRGAGRPTT